jgi:hypothetical protein
MNIGSGFCEEDVLRHLSRENRCRQKEDAIDLKGLRI